MKKGISLLLLCLIPLLAAGCEKKLEVKEVIPPVTKAGAGFNVQPGGMSALAIEARGATPGTIVLMDGQVLSTTYGNPKLISALVPPAMYAQPGQRKVELMDGSRKSNTVLFTVMP